MSYTLYTSKDLSNKHGQAIMKKILVVDDEELVLNQISEILEDAGYDVFKGKDGSEAIELFEKTNPDLLLIDIRMPNIDGYEAYFEIKKRHKDAKIVFMSAFPIENESYSKIREFGLMYLLNKPFSINVLKDTVKEVMKDN